MKVEGTSSPGEFAIPSLSPGCLTFDRLETRARSWLSPSPQDGNLALVFQLWQPTSIALTSASDQFRSGVRKGTSRSGWKPTEEVSGIRGWTVT